jgi:hypothetical protein
MFPGPRSRSRYPDRVSANRLGDILDPMAAERAVVKIELVPDRPYPRATRSPPRLLRVAGRARSNPPRAGDRGEDRGWRRANPQRQILC